jgi:hypothetical protein
MQTPSTEAVVVCFEAAASSFSDILCSMLVAVLAAILGFYLLKGWLALWNTSYRGATPSILSLASALAAMVLALTCFGAVRLEQFVNEKAGELGRSLAAGQSFTPVCLNAVSVIGVVHQKLNRPTPTANTLKIRNLEEWDVYCQAINDTALAALSLAPVPMLRHAISGGDLRVSKLSKPVGLPREVTLGLIDADLARAQVLMLDHAEEALSDVAAQASGSVLKLLVVGVIATLVPLLALCARLAWVDIFQAPRDARKRF